MVKHHFATLQRTLVVSMAAVASKYTLVPTYLYPLQFCRQAGWLAATKCCGSAPTTRNFWQMLSQRKKICMELH
jgi:hypothetical protein